MKEAPKIILEYRREGELSTGNVSGPFEAQSFTTIAFDRMLYLLASKIIEVGECEVSLVRNDRPGYRPYRLDHASVELLRQDPVAAVQAFTYAGSPSSIFQRVQKERLPSIPSLRVGLDVLADAFGEKVYAKLREGDVECPGCGFWSPLVGTCFECKKRCRVTLVVEPRDRWAGVSVRDLLSTGLSQFYLPREWNPQPWVSRADLEDRLFDFIHEREETICSMQATADLRASGSPQVSRPSAPAA